MDLKHQKILILVALAIFPAMAQETKPVAPPDKQNLSYALGMNLALEIKGVGVDVDASVVAQAIKDVLQGNPTKIQESQIVSILGRAE